MQIRQVDPGLSDWARLVTGIEAAFSHAPKHRSRTFESTKASIESGGHVWFAAYDGDKPIVDFLLVKTLEGSKGVMNVDIMFGPGFSEINQLVADFFIAYAKYNKCSYLRYGTFNKAVARLYAKLPAFATATQFYVFEKEIL
jgi:hypothetical protein